MMYMQGRALEIPLMWLVLFYNLWLKYMFMKYLEGLNPLKITAKIGETNFKMTFFQKRGICETNE